MPNPKQGLKQSRAKRVAPPRDLPAKVRGIFRTVVDAFPPSYFTGADVAALTAYAEAAIRAGDLNAALRREGVTVTLKNGDVRPNPLAFAARQAEQSVSMLATKLRIAKSARLRHELDATLAKAAVMPPKPWEPGTPQWWDDERIYRRSLPQREARARAKHFGPLPR